MRTEHAEQSWTVRTAADLGRAIAEIRSACDLTQADLAENAAMERTYLARLESAASPPLVIERTLRALREMGAEITITLPAAPPEDTHAA